MKERIFTMTNEKLLSATDDQISKVLDASIGGHGFWLVNHREIIEKMISDRIEETGVSQTMMDVGYSWLRSENEPYSDLELDMYETIAKYNGDIDKEGRMTKKTDIYKAINRRIRDQKIKELENIQITEQKNLSSNEVIDLNNGDHITFHSIEFAQEYAENNKIPIGNLHLDITDGVEYLNWSNDDEIFVRAALVDEMDKDVIFTSFSVKTPGDFSQWWEDNFEEIENKVIATNTVTSLNEEIEFRKLPKIEQQRIIDQQNGLIDLFELDSIGKNTTIDNLDNQSEKSKIPGQKNEWENNLNQFKSYKEAMEAAYPDVTGDDGFLEPDEEGLDVLRYVDENKLSQIFTESNTLDEFKTNTKQALKEEEIKSQKELQEQQDQYWQEQFEEQEKTDDIYAKYAVDGDIWNIKPEWFADSKNKEIDSDLITKTLEERTPEQIAAWNAQGGAPALLDAYWAGLDDKQRGELIQYVRYYNETNYNTDVFFDHDTGAIDDLESHNIEFVEEEKFEALGLTDEVKREYQTLWTVLNDSSVDQPYRLANISKLELETHFNKLQNLLNNEQDQLEVSSKNIEQISINELQEELLDIETQAENLNLKLTDAQREQIQALPPEGRRYILDSLKNVTPVSQVSTNSHAQNQVETDLDMEIF